MSDLTRMKRIAVTKADGRFFYYASMPHFEAAQIQVWLQRFPDVVSAVLEDEVPGARYEAISPAELERQARLNKGKG